ncbi:hypothetical protein KM043_015127 [Ampulex compressa]|nr:hypothetical protein KM043_015127 [Ampulex compressa]
MSVETRMYALKPIISLPDTLTHSKSMYELKNIHGVTRMDDHTGDEIRIVPDITEQAPLPEFTALEARQEKILSQLAELKKQVSTLCNFLKGTNKTTSAKDCKNKEPVNLNLIINVNPTRPPYSLLALRKIWKDTDVKVQAYVHSSIATEVPKIQGSDTNTPGNNTLDLCLIWKEVKDLEFITGLHGYPLQGEVNLLRYISRVINTHDYENDACPMETHVVDSILDLCHWLSVEKSERQRYEVLHILGNKLEKYKRAKNNQPSIAEIAAWSVMKQLCLEKLPLYLEKWFRTNDMVFI